MHCVQKFETKQIFKSSWLKTCFHQFCSFCVDQYGNDLWLVLIDLDWKRFLLRESHSHLSEYWRDSCPSKEYVNRMHRSSRYVWLWISFKSNMIPAFRNRAIICSFFASNLQKNNIFPTSIWDVQHLNAGLNIQHQVADIQISTISASNQDKLGNLNLLLLLPYLVLILEKKIFLDGWTKGSELKKYTFVT